MNRKLNALQDMSTSQHLLSQLHQISYTMLPIPNEFLQLESNQGNGFGAVELQAPSETFLSEETEIRKQELVLSYTRVLVSDLMPKNLAEIPLPVLEAAVSLCSRVRSRNSASTGFLRMREDVTSCLTVGKYPLCLPKQLGSFLGPRTTKSRSKPGQNADPWLVARSRRSYLGSKMIS